MISKSLVLTTITLSLLPIVAPSATYADLPQGPAASGLALGATARLLQKDTPGSDPQNYDNSAGAGGTVGWHVQGLEIRDGLSFGTTLQDYHATAAVEVGGANHSTPSGSSGTSYVAADVDMRGGTGIGTDFIGAPNVYAMLDGEAQIHLRSDGADSQQDHAGFRAFAEGGFLIKGDPVSNMQRGAALTIGALGGGQLGEFGTGRATTQLAGLRLRLSAANFGKLNIDYLTALDGSGYGALRGGAAIRLSPSASIVVEDIQETTRRDKTLDAPLGTASSNTFSVKAVAAF